MKRVPSDMSLIDAVFNKYITSHCINNPVLFGKVRSLLKVYFRKIEIQFDDYSIKSFLFFSEKDTACLRRKYGKFSDCCASKDSAEIISKFQRYIYIDFENAMKTLLCDLQYSNQSFIADMRDKFPKGIISTLKRSGIETLEQLLNLSKNELFKFWNPYSKNGNVVIDRVHLMGYTFSGESTFCLFFDNGEVFNVFYDSMDYLDLCPDMYYSYIAPENLKSEDKLELNLEMCKSKSLHL